MKRLAGFLAVAFALTASLTAAGYVLLPRFYGFAGAQAAIWASAVALFGSLAGVVPLLSGVSPGSAHETPADDGQSGTSSGGVGGVPGGPLVGASRFLASMLLRLGAVGIGALAVGLFGVVHLEPFLLWLAVSYLALLVVDTALSLRIARSL